MTACNKTAVRAEDRFCQPRAIRLQGHNNTTFVIDNWHNQTGVVYTNRPELGSIGNALERVKRIYKHIETHQKKSQVA